jgi:hypothetical protein
MLFHVSITMMNGISLFVCLMVFNATFNNISIISWMSVLDKICNKVSTKATKVSSGSLAKGLDLPGSDIDVMYVLNDFQIMQNVQHYV